jgi:hypothetical protein
MERRITTAVALAGLGLGLVPIAASGQSDKQDRALTLSAAPTRVVFNRVTTLSGRLIGVNPGGQTVGLEADGFPLDRYGRAGVATTAPDGTFSFRTRPRTNTRYRVRYRGAASGPVTVLVRIRVRMAADDYTPRAGTRVAFAGRACPQHDGARVAIQRRTTLGWRTVKRTSLREAQTCSVFGTLVRVRGDGTYRAVVAGDSDHARGISARRRIDAH